MKILVTGGAGFIGSHVVDAYLAAGHRVVVADNFSTGKRSNLDGADTAMLEVVELDIRDAKALRELIARVKPDAVNHHAAQVSVSVSTQDPIADASLNVVGTATLLESIRLEAPKAKVIYATSGGAMYGSTAPIPYVEDGPAEPTSPYGLSKLTAERYVWLFAGLYGLNATVLRYSNIYGPRQDPHGEAGVCSIFTDRMLAGKPVTIFGEGTATRDYTYVGDVARANLMVLEAGDGEAFNVCTGKGTTTQEVFDALKKAIGYAGDPTYGELRPGEILNSVLAPDKAYRVLGWQAETSFEEGVARTVEWCRAAAKK